MIVKIKYTVFLLILTVPSKKKPFTKNTTQIRVVAFTFNRP